MKKSTRNKHREIEAAEYERIKASIEQIAENIAKRHVPNNGKRIGGVNHDNNRSI